MEAKRRLLLVEDPGIAWGRIDSNFRLRRLATVLLRHKTRSPCVFRFLASFFRAVEREPPTTQGTSGVFTCSHNSTFSASEEEVGRPALLTRHSQRDPQREHDHHGERRHMLHPGLRSLSGSLRVSLSLSAPRPSLRTEA